jgi:carboxypeptidase family protein/TonB-dependent receptor-like protein
MSIWRRAVGVACILLMMSVGAHAQVQTGSIAGVVTDSSNLILPGATVSLSGEKLIGGVQTQTTDAIGAYRFDRLPPGSYHVKFELQGFKSIERDDIRVSAAFVATVAAKLEVGSVSETITVTGESPTVDTKSNLQQTVMTQEILEGVPSGRDPWSIAKIIPGVQVSTYDVGGTQSIQQSSLSSHGSSTNDVSYNIDGATVNWPGGGGGATMLYYDQGMFEEVNYMTSAIPAEVMVGGVSINMVTKDAGNKWRGDTRYSYSNGCASPTNPTPGCLESDNLQPGIASGTLPATLLGNPTQTTYDFNLAGGGALVTDRLWVNGSIRRWTVNKLVNARNPDKTQAIDDNLLKNYSGKAVFSASADQKIVFSYNWNNKIRGHRRDTNQFQPDIASVVQTNPASSTQARYTGIRNKVVFESSVSYMNGETDYNYQPGTPSTAYRVEDSALNTAIGAAQRQEYQPNSRAEFDNVVSYSKSGLGGDHLIKGGVQFARLYFDDKYTVLNDMFLQYNNGKATSVTEYNTPTEGVNVDREIGFFLQDAWSLASHLTVNLGLRVDHNVGILPAQSTPGGQFVAAQSIPQSTPINQNLAVWRAGLVWDPLGDGKTALKTSYSRYGLQVGIDRVTNVNPFSNATRSCTWTDPNGDGIPQASEISNCGAFPGLNVHYAGPDGPSWPFSDEITAGIERQVMPDMRIGVMYYHRTNRNQIGTRNTAVPPSDYTAATVSIPNGPNGATTATLYNLSNVAFNSQTLLILDNQPYLDTVYNGVEFTASKRLSHRWQMVAGLTVGKNTGGLNSSNGQASTISSTTGGDLNDPNTLTYGNGIVGNDSPVAFRLSGSYQAPWNLLVAGTLISNSGFPYISTYSVTKAAFPGICTSGCAGGLVRSSQFVFLSDRGDERLPAVTQIDLRVSRSFRFGQNRRIVPQIDLFNVGNSYTPTSVVAAVGPTWRQPSAIISPRIARVGFSINF